jgi:NAD(P)-dependent dehydrogenase (short-subunit alcohol dehydrogenase family)
MTLDLEIDGSVALVTGAGRGIGRAVALELARRGAQVIACARTAKDLEEAKAEASDLRGSIEAASLDVTDATAVTELVERTNTDRGPIRLLVNNAGIFDAQGRFSDVSVSTWWRDVEVNLGGAVNCAHAVVPGMRKSGGGRIVNMISGAAFVRFPSWTSYITSKAALQVFTECLAAELGNDSIHVFSLVPGVVRTRPVQQGLDRGIDEVAGVMKALIAQGLELPVERPAVLTAALCAGEADELSGRFFDATEDFATVLERATQVVDQDLYVTRAERLA